MEFGVIKLSSPLSSSALNLQDFSSPVGRNHFKKSLHPQLLSSPLPKPFLQLNDRPHSFPYQQNSDHLSPRTYRRSISAEAGKQSWDLGRFLKTIFFFNEPPSPAKFFEFVSEKLSSPSPSKPEKKMETSGIVLVAGATGGVGRRVVDVLRKKGLPVRVLVRNEEKARKMLGPDVDLIVGDITKESTLVPEYFKGVRRVINAVSVIVGPKEGDTPDRQKYSQGIKFFEPEIKGDSPEKVEYIGIRNLIKAVKGSVGLQNGKLLFGFEGVVSTANNGGFTSIRTKNLSTAEDLSAYDGLELRLKGDGRRYKLIVRTSRDWDTVGYTAGFDTVGDQWQT
ncbi:hypothetical protein GBA52_012689, partial [Prunus armeniaca]